VVLVAVVGAPGEARASNAGERGAVVLALGCRQHCAGVELEEAHAARATRARGLGHREKREVVGG
jgi:hypothetical protein